MVYSAAGAARSAPADGGMACGGDSARPFPSALNGQLRTGADKGNPTV